MDIKKIQNPFIIGNYIDDFFFCDREKETVFMQKQIENGRNVTIISPRRMGKSGLIHHFFNQERIKECYDLFFIDLYSTSSLAEFVCLFGKEVFERLKSRGEKWRERMFQVVKSLRAGFKLDVQTGMPVFDIGIGEIPSPQTSLKEIFSYLEKSEKPCIVALDEFQQVGNYDEKNTEALLRTFIQQCSNVHFIFAGSKQHMMSNMFSSPSKPFYQSAISMGLEPIPADIYAEFATRLFNAYNKQVEHEVPLKVWSLYEGHTWFVQMVMNELFAITPTGGACTLDMIDEAIQNVVMVQETTYKETLSRIPSKQKMLLQALAKEGIANNITSSKFIKKYALLSASSVQASAKLLLKNDIITKTDNKYRIYDFFFAQWLAKVL